MAKSSLNYVRTVQVAKDKSDVVQYTTITLAIAAITARGSPATGKRFAVYVHPGEYDETVGMVDYVDVIAIGGREETIITHTEDTTPDTETVSGAIAMIKGFTIVSDGTTVTPRCVENAKDGFDIDDCVLRIDNATGSPIALLTTNSMDIRNSYIDIAVPGVPAASTTAVSLDTNTENYNIDNCKIGGLTNSILLNNCLTLNLTRSTLYNLFVHTAAATGTVVRASVLEAIDFDGGTLTMHQTYVESIAADTGGAVTAYGGTIRACTSTGTTFVWWLSDHELKVIVNMKIAHALAAPPPADSVIHIAPGTYGETGLAMVAGVGLVGTDPDLCSIIASSETTPIISSAVDCFLSNLNIGGTHLSNPAILVTADELILKNCYVYGTGVGDAIGMTGGSLVAYDTQIGVGDIDLSANACGLAMYRCRITTDPVDTGGAGVGHTLVFEQCDFGNQNIVSAATGTTTLDMTGCSHVGAITNTSAEAGDFTIRDSDVGDVITASVGDITVYGGDVWNCSSVFAGGQVLWWKHTDLLYVLGAMRVEDAVNASLAGDTVQLSQGSWTLGAVMVVRKSINVIGEGPEESIVTISDGGPVFNVGDDTGHTDVACTFQGLKIENSGAGEAIQLVSGTDSGDTTVVVRECILDGQDCVRLDAVGNQTETFEAFETEFNATAVCIDVDHTTISDIDIHNCEFVAGAVANLTGQNHTFDAWDCEMGGGGITVAADVPPIVLIRCNDVGAIGSLTNTLAIEHCTVGNVTTTTGGVTIEHSTVGILTSANATVDVYNSYVAEATPTAGTQTYYNCEIEEIDSGGGAIVVHGGDILLVSGATGTIVWWEGDHILKVMASTVNMKIADALAVATSGDTIKIGQSTAALPFAESGLTAVDGVDIIGEGPNVSIIEATDAGNPIITVGSGVSCVFENVKISNLGAHQTIDLAAGDDPAVLTVENCILKSDGANSIVAVTASATDPADFTAYDTIFDTAADAITVSGAVISDVVARNCAFISCTLAFSTTGANHTFDISSCDFNTAGVTLTANVPAVTIVDCDAIGTFTHSTASTVTLRNCNVSGAYTVAAVVGVVDAKDCIMGAFTDNGSGTSSFILCETGALDNAATADMSLEQCSTGTITQGAAAGTITISNSTTGALVTGAGGAIALLGMCWFPDITTNAGKITWQLDLTTWRVVDGTADMKIMDAADDAAAGDLILIGPGSFSEALALDTGVNACTYRGMGRDKTTITATGNTVLVNGITGVVFEDLTIEASAGTDGQYALELDASTTATASVTLRNVTVDMTGSAGTVYGILVIDDGANTATVLAYDCYVEADSGGTNYAVAANTCTTGASTISLHGCELNGADYDIYNDRITIDTHSCELSGGGWWIQNNATAIGLAFNNEAPNTITPVTFAGAAGEFADLTGAELYTCAAGVLIGEAVYVSAAGNTVVEATNAAAAPIPAEGIVVYKPGGAGVTICYVKNSGMAYMATPPVAWVAGTNVWLGVTGAQLVARPSNALKQVLGVGVDTKRMLINISEVEVVTKVATLPVWPGAGSAPTGTHINANSRKAVAIVGAGGQTVFSHAWEVPEDFLSLGALKVIVFPTGTGSFDWTAYSSKCATTELENDGSDSDTANTVGVTDDTILDHDITTAADGFTLEEGDHFNCDILIDVLTTITQLLVLGFRVEYNAQRGA